MPIELTADQLLELEQLIDQTSLANVLGAIADICGEKCEHLLANWMDEAAASAWRQAAENIETLTQDESVLRVSIR